MATIQTLAYKNALNAPRIALLVLKMDVMFAPSDSFLIKLPKSVLVHVKTGILLILFLRTVIFVTLPVKLVIPDLLLIALAVRLAFILMVIIALSSVRTNNTKILLTIHAKR